jgi:hypothetical protein
LVVELKAIAPIAVGAAPPITGTTRAFAEVSLLKLSVDVPPKVNDPPVPIVSAVAFVPVVTPLKGTAEAVAAVVAVVAEAAVPVMFIGAVPALMLAGFRLVKPAPLPLRVLAAIAPVNVLVVAPN